MKRLLSPSPPSKRRVVAAAFLLPAAAVGIARGVGSENLAAATALCLLAVVAASAVAGRGSGIVAALLSFVALNFFFIEPRHTLIVQKTSDLIALVAFLLSALVVGTLLSWVLEERDRAQRRAIEAQLLSRTTARTLANQTALATERAVLDEKAREARLEAEASHLRATLFSSVTHDLKTPLASIKASASGLLTDGTRYTEAQRVETLSTIVEEADRLNQVVSNLLDLARARAGTLVPSKQSIFVEEIIESVLRRMKRRLERVSLQTNVRADLPPVLADPVQIEQVLSNLIENAVRFSPPGGEIQISVATWQGAVQIRIADRGPGIPSEDRERVFDDFYQRDAGPGRGGTGLGLAIARAIVRAHGGRIWAEGSPGGGATILFELPIATETPTGTGVPTERASP